MKKLLLLLLLSPLILMGEAKIALQVLGSGGPESGDKRASSGYIVWIDGKSRVLVDFGGGTSLRFEEAGAKIEDLDVILLTHLHIDHTADLPALLKSSFFVRRTKDLPVFGPRNNDFMPSTKNFIERLFKNNKGAWQYMGDYLDGTASFQVKAHTVTPTKTVKSIYKKGYLSIQTITVHHGPIPALAYRVTVGKKSITFSGDMNGEYHTLERLAKNTNILVAHNAVPKGAKGVGANLHMTPLTIGKIASKAKVGSLILSHRMLRTLGKEKETKKEIRKSYKGSVKFANDLSFYKVR
jgi:ribonuclease BN (tRNA processing enzyme)